MKAACEVCGTQLRSPPVRVEIDGAVMVVCGNCAKLGRPVAGQAVKVHVSPVQVSMRTTTSDRPSTMMMEAADYEIDPDYNLKIRQAREKMGLSQEELGKLINQKPSLIRMVESKKLKPDVLLTRKFMHQLKINLLVSTSELEGDKPRV